MTSKYKRKVWPKSKILSMARNVLKEQSLQRLPSCMPLRKLGYRQLSDQLHNYPGGTPQLRLDLGEKRIKRKNGHWDTETIFKEAQRIMRIEGWNVLPAARNVPDKYSPFYSAIFKNYPGKIPQLRKDLGENETRKEHGYWHDLENTLNEARKYMDENELSYLPGMSKLNQDGYSSLSHAITDIHGGFPEFRKILGQENLKKESGYWTIENIISEVQVVMEKEEWDELPSVKFLNDNSYTSLGSAIARHPGGIRKVREVLGEVNKRRENGYWKNPRNIEKEAKLAMEEKQWNELPGGTILSREGYSSLNRGATLHYPGGMKGLRSVLGKKKFPKESGYWKNIKNIISEAQIVMEENDWDELPSTNILIDNGYSSLCRAIYLHYPGRIDALRRKLTQGMNIHTENQKLEKLLNSYIQN